MQNMYNQSYDLPEAKEVFLDRNKGEIIEKSEISPFEVIRTTAAASGVTIKDPKKSCTKCYGRGYTAVETTSKMPIPCKCIYPAASEQERAAQAQFDAERMGGQMNRLQRRDMRKQFRKMIKKNPNQFIKTAEATEGESDV